MSGGAPPARMLNGVAVPVGEGSAEGPGGTTAFNPTPSL